MYLPEISGPESINERKLSIFSIRINLSSGNLNMNVRILGEIERFQPSTAHKIANMLLKYCTWYNDLNHLYLIFSRYFLANPLIENQYLKFSLYIDMHICMCMCVCFCLYVYFMAYSGSLLFDSTSSVFASVSRLLRLNQNVHFCLVNYDYTFSGNDRKGNYIPLILWTLMDC